MVAQVILFSRKTNHILITAAELVQIFKTSICKLTICIITSTKHVEKQALFLVCHYKNKCGAHFQTREQDESFLISSIKYS